METIMDRSFRTPLPLGGDGGGLLGLVFVHQLIRHYIIDDLHTLPQPVFNLRQGDHRRLFRLAPLSVQSPCAVLLRLTVATADGTLALLAAVVAPLLRGPLQQFVQVHAVAVHQECRMHHVVVVVPTLVHQSAPCQSLLHPWPCILHAYMVRACRILPSRFPPFLVGRKVGRQDLLVGNHERLCLQVHIHIRIVGQSAQPRIVSTLRVVLMPHQFSIVSVAFEEGCRKAHPQPLPKGGGIGQTVCCRCAHVSINNA